MTIITLNVWGGKVHDPLLQFFRTYANTTDVFCLQEVFYRGLFLEIEKILHDFDSRSFYAPETCLFEGKPMSPGTRVGLTIFVRKTIPIVRHGEHQTYRRKDITDNNTGAFQFVELEMQSYRVLVGNFHGLHWGGSDKEDNEARMEQSHIVGTILEEESLPTILCGDFNLFPHTKSISILEHRLRNTSMKHDVRSTRTSLYIKGPHHVSDYILTSKEIMVENCEVLSDEVSDHFPLRLQFSMPLQR